MNKPALGGHIGPSWGKLALADCVGSSWGRRLVFSSLVSGKLAFQIGLRKVIAGHILSLESMLGLAGLSACNGIAQRS